MAINNTVQSPYGGLFSPSSPSTPLNTGGMTSYGQSTGLGSFLGGLFKAPSNTTSLTGGNPSSLFNNPLPSATPMNLNQPTTNTQQGGLNLNQAFSSGGLSGTNPSSSQGLTSDHITGLIDTVQGLQKSLNNYQKQSQPVVDKQTGNSFLSNYDAPSGGGQTANPAVNTTPQNNINATTGLPNTNTQLPGSNQGSAFPSIVAAGSNLIQNEDPTVTAARNALLQFQQQEAGIPAMAGAGGEQDLQFVGGKEQVMKQQAAAQEQALSNALQSATTSQGQRLGLVSPLLSATQPYPTAFGQTSFAPSTGQFGEGGAGGITPGSAMDNALNQYAQMAANGQISSIPSSITGNAILNAELQKRAKAINPSYTPTTSAATGSSAADLTGQASNIQASANGAEANFNLMTNIAQQGGVNDSNVPILNTLQQNVQKGLTSSSAVANFQALIKSVRSQYASIIGGGNVTVEALQEAQSLIPDNISLSALQSLGTNLKSDAGNRVAGIKQQISNLTGSQGTSGGTSANLTWANI